MKQKIKKYVQEWEQKCYFDGIPDQAPKELEKRNLVPSYKIIALSILSNDYGLKKLGQSPIKSKYYDYYKKIELENRQNCKQLKLDL